MAEELTYLDSESLKGALESLLLVATDAITTADFPRSPMQLLPKLPKRSKSLQRSTRVATGVFSSER